MTPETGSYRYMAPEVFRHDPYDWEVDVYSYAIVAFEILEARQIHSPLAVRCACTARILHGTRVVFAPRQACRESAARDEPE